MSRQFFTNEQIESLRQNPHVLSVSAAVLVFRKEFKERFYAEYMEGAFPRDILKNTGLTLLSWENTVLLALHGILRMSMPNMADSMKADDRQTDLEQPKRLLRILQKRSSSLSGMSLNICGRSWSI